MTKNVPANLLHEQKLQTESKELKPGQEGFYRIWQDYTSPFSHKVMTYMHYKGIPYKRINTTATDFMETIPSMVGQTIIPVMLTPDDEVLQDSTPILEWFEEKYSEKAAIPEDERLAFIMWLIEEFADEYMPRIHMHTRWGNDQNRNTMSNRIGRGMTYGMPDMNSKDMAAFFLERQSGFDHHLGLNGEDVRASMDQQILDLLEILEAHFCENQFLLGFKPSLADFALYGPLRIHLFNDPQSNEIMEVNAPRTCRWMDTIAELGDTRGCAGQTEFGDWVSLDDGFPETLKKLLGFIGRTYIPFAKACAVAGGKKEKRFDAEVYGVKASFSTHQYRVWSFEQLQLRYERLSAFARDYLESLFLETAIQPTLMAGEIIHNGLFDSFTPPVVKNGVSDARVRHMKEKAAKAAGNQ